MKVHELKCWETHWDALADGSKTFEIRRDDRQFQKGDFLLIRKFDVSKEDYVKNVEPLIFKVTHVSTYLQKENVVVMGIHPQACLP